MIRALLAARRAAVHAPEDDAADFDRLLRWLAQASAGRALGWPSDRLRRRLLEKYLRSGGAVRSHIRRWIAAALEKPDQPAFDDALALAVALPTPEARPALLAYLADYAVPPGSAAPQALDDAHASRLASAIEAVSGVADARDREVFAYLVAQFCRSPMNSDAHWAVARGAAIAFARAAPDRASESLPVFFRRDPAVAVHLPTSAPR